MEKALDSLLPIREVGSAYAVAFYIVFLGILIRYYFYMRAHQPGYANSVEGHAMMGLVSFFLGISIDGCVIVFGLWYYVKTGVRINSPYSTAGYTVGLFFKFWGVICMISNMAPRRWAKWPILVAISIGSSGLVIASYFF